MVDQLAAAYEAGADDMARSVAYTIADLLLADGSSADVLDGVVALVFGRLEMARPQDEWFRRHGAG